MKKIFKAAVVLCCGLTVMASLARADSLLTPGDPIIAFDFDASSNSNYPGGEEPWQALDGFSDTKYLNFGQRNSGLIVTPIFGSSTVRSMFFTTANDAPERDPAAWQIFGTNDFILSQDNSDAAGGENWTLIAGGDVALPDDRFTDGPVLSFANSTTYQSYLIVFPQVKNPATANSMQVADIYLFESSDASGSSILNFFDDARAVHLPVPESRYPANESPPSAIDGDVNTKYLNFGRENSGFIVTPSVGSTIIDSFQLTTANDAVERDPAGWELYGTDSPIASVDNGTGNDEPWTLIDSGVMDLPVDRFTAGSVVPVNNSTAYTSYRMVITSVRDGMTANSLQFAEVQFFGEIVGGGVNGDFNGDGFWNLTDIDALVAEIAGGGGDLAFDLTGDGVVNGDDLADWLVVGGANNPGLTGGNPFLPGDANLSGDVDVSDFNAWNGAKFTNTATWSGGDFNASGAVDVSDFNFWNSNKFQSSAGLAAVPEPGTLCGWLILMGGWCLAGRRRARSVIAV